MNAGPQHFSLLARVLHWLMAVLIIAMLFIGVGMAGTASARYATLLDIHRPLGIAVLVLAAIRLANRVVNPPPPLPALPKVQALAAKLSHYVMYALMFIVPLLGWAMQSAAPYPIKLYGQLRLPTILQPDVTLYAQLRHLHTDFALLFYAVILLHLGAALMHAWIRRDGVYESMASARSDSHQDK